MLRNTVRLTGFAYNPKERTTASGKVITRFGMKVYAGKDSDGKSKYDFVNVMHFGQLPQGAKEVDVMGRLAVDNWEKDGIKHHDVYVFAEKVYDPNKKEEKEEEKQVETFDDEIPWG